MSKRRAKRDTYRYHFIKDGKIVHRGITDDLDRREQEHQQQYRRGWIKKIGPIVTRETALEWERKGGKRL